MQNHLQDCQVQFLAKLKTEGKSINTLKNYRTDLQCFNDFLGQLHHTYPRQLLGMRQVVEYDQFLQKKYTSSNSKRRRIQTLRLYYDFLVQQGLEKENFIKKLPPAPKFVDIPRPPPFEAILKLWEYLCHSSGDEHPLQALIHQRNQLIFLFIYGSGLKVSDLEQLQINQLFLPDRLLITTVNAKRDPYTVPLTPAFASVYSRYQQNAQQLPSKYGVAPSDFVFFNANLHCILAPGISARGIEVLFKEWQQHLQVPITAKNLRQAAIYKWIQQGSAANNIKEWMGVAPSYCLKYYSDHAPVYFYTENFLLDTLERARQGRNYFKTSS